MGVKVQSTSNPEIFIWVNTSTEEVQNCRQIAAMNTVILTENQSNETSEGTGKFVAQHVTLKAKGNLVHVQQPIQGTGALPWRDYIRCILKDNPNMIKGLTPCQIHGKLTSQHRKIDVKFV